MQQWNCIQSHCRQNHANNKTNNYTKQPAKGLDLRGGESRKYRSKGAAQSQPQPPSTHTLTSVRLSVCLTSIFYHLGLLHWQYTVRRVPQSVKRCTNGQFYVRPDSLYQYTMVATVCICSTDCTVLQLSICSATQALTDVYAEKNTCRPYVTASYLLAEKQKLL